MPATLNSHFCRALAAERDFAQWIRGNDMMECLGVHQVDSMVNEATVISRLALTQIPSIGE